MSLDPTLGRLTGVLGLLQAVYDVLECKEGWRRHDIEVLLAHRGFDINQERLQDVLLYLERSKIIEGYDSKPFIGPRWRRVKGQG